VIIWLRKTIDIAVIKIQSKTTGQILYNVRQTIVKGSSLSVRSTVTVSVFLFCTLCNGGAKASATGDRQGGAASIGGGGDDTAVICGTSSIGMSLPLILSQVAEVRL